jgi:hypothetical protein
MYFFIGKSIYAIVSVSIGLCVIAAPTLKLGINPSYVKLSKIVYTIIKPG